MFIVFLFTLIFTVFTACNNNSCLLCPYLLNSLYLLLIDVYCSYLHWYSLYLLLVTIIYVYFVPIYIDIHCIYWGFFVFTLILTVFTACSYNWGFFCSYLHWYSLLYCFACNYNIRLLCSYLHWYSLYLLLVATIEVSSVPIYIDIHCIYCLQL